MAGQVRLQRMSGARCGCGARWRAAAHCCVPQITAGFALAQLVREGMLHCALPMPLQPFPLPMPFSWFALEQLVREGKLRAAGVSNFNLDQVRNRHKAAVVASVLLTRCGL